MPIIPNADLYRGCMFYGIGEHVVYANLSLKMLIMTAVVSILKANTVSSKLMV